MGVPNQRESFGEGFDKSDLGLIAVPKVETFRGLIFASFDPEACIALPSAMIAVMGPEAAVNAVYFNKIQALPEDEQAAFVAECQMTKLALALDIDPSLGPAWTVLAQQQRFR